MIDFANYMGIGKNTAYAEVKSGAIKTFKLGTIKHRRTIISDENTKSDNVPLGNE